MAMINYYQGNFFAANGGKIFSMSSDLVSETIDVEIFKAKESWSGFETLHKKNASLGLAYAKTGKSTCMVHRAEDPNVCSEEKMEVDRAKAKCLAECMSNASKMDGPMAFRFNEPVVVMVKKAHENVHFDYGQVFLAKGGNISSASEENVINALGVAPSYL